MRAIRHNSLLINFNFNVYYTIFDNFCQCIYAGISLLSSEKRLFRVIPRQTDKLTAIFHKKTVAFREKIVYNIKAARGWGASGTLYLKSAISEPTAFLDEVYGRPRAVRNVDSKVLCNAMP